VTGALAMKAAILAGGLGTRMRPLTFTTPKPLLPILNVPMLVRTIERLPRGVDGVVLAVNYLAEQIGAYLKAHPPALPVKLILEEQPLGTAGAVRNLERELGGERFFVLNGDVITSVDLGAMVEFHKRRKGVGTLHLWPVEDPTRFGIARLDSEGRITEFKEKPRLEEAFSNLINAGTYILEPEVLDLIPKGRAVSIEQEIFPQLLPKGLFGYVSGEFWIDAGKPLDYIEAHRLLMNEDRGRYRPRRKSPGVTVEPPCLIPPSTELAPGVKIGPNVSLGEAVVIGEGAQVNDSVLLDEVRVGAHARIEHSVIGNRAFIGDGARISRGTVVADGAEVAPGRRTANFESVHAVDTKRQN
jgi:mannose-1-phosphate guanylyltransferase